MILCTWATVWVPSPPISPGLTDLGKSSAECFMLRGVDLGGNREIRWRFPEKETGKEYGMDLRYDGYRDILAAQGRVCDCETRK